MRLSPIATALLVGSAVGCAASQPRATDETQAGSPRPELNTEIDTLEADFRKFIASPGTIPDPRFATLEEVNGEVRFAAVPDGWLVRKERYPSVWIVVHDEDGFHTTICITQKVSSQEQDVPSMGVPDVWCSSGQGGKGTGIVTLRECRTVGTRYGRIEIELRVKSERESTPAEGLAHVRKQYGKYQGVYQEVQRLAAPK